jgi:predicted ATPase with chaperone activity
MYLLHDHGLPLSKAHLGAAAGPDRHASRVEVPRVDYEKLSNDRLGEPSKAARARVETARERQRARFEGTSLTCNVDTGPAGIRQPVPVGYSARWTLRVRVLPRHQTYSWNEGMCPRCH